MVSSINMPSSYVYLYHIDKKFDIPVTPDSISNTASVSYSTEPVLGRSAPLVTFSSAGPRVQNVSLSLHRQMMDLENGSSDTVDNLIKALVAATLPSYIDASKAIVPPSILCRFGNETCIRGVIQGDVQCQASGPWLKNGKMAMIQISFNILEVENFSAESAIQDGFLRSVSTNLARSAVWKY